MDDRALQTQCIGLLSHSAGVGRTGTFICIDNVLEQIKKEKLVDIAGAINKMRHQRMKMVQTLVCEHVF
jgi:protein tyrosine phosphatase